MLIDIRAKVAAGIRAKRTLAQIQATRPAAAYGMADGFIKPDQFVAFVHESLTKKAIATDNPPHRRMGRGPGEAW